MRNLQNVGLWTYTLLLLTSTGLVGKSLATQPPGMRDPFFEAMRQAHNENPDHEILELLWSEKVRELLKFDEKDFQKERDRFGSHLTSMRELHDATRKEKMSVDELKIKIVELSSPSQETAFKSLESDQRLDRLIGIYIQVNGYKAAAAAQVAKRIGLADEQLEDFRKAKAEHWGLIMKDISKEIEVLVRDRGHDHREKMTQLMRHAKKKLNWALKDKLDDAQRRALAALEGEEIPEVEKLIQMRPMQRGGPRRRTGGDSGERRDNQDGKPSSGDPKKDGRGSGRDREQDCCSCSANQPGRENRCPGNSSPVKICLPIQWPTTISYIR